MLATIGVGLVALTCAVLLIVGALVQERPSWWCQIDAEGEEVRQLGTAVQNAAASMASDLYPIDPDATTAELWISEPWSLAFTREQANAWLNAYMPKWVTNQSEQFVWPPQVGVIQVDFQDGRILIAAELFESARSDRAGSDARSLSGLGTSGGPEPRTRERPGQVVGATLAPSMDQSGALWMRAERLHLGRLPLPAEWMLRGPLSGLKEKLPRSVRDLPEAQGMFDAFSGLNPAIQNPTLRLPDGRRVRLLSMHVNRGMLVLTCRTEQKR